MAMPAVLGHEAAGTVEAVGDQVFYGKAGGPCYMLPLGLLRPLPQVPSGPARAVRAGRCSAVAVGPPSPQPERSADHPDDEPVLLRRADAGPRELGGQDTRRRAFRGPGANRVRCDDRGRRGSEHRARRARQHGGGDRLWRRRPQLHPGRRSGRCFTPNPPKDGLGDSP